MGCAIAILDYDVLCFNVSQLPQTSEKCAQVRIGVGGSKQQHADPPHPLALLRLRRERPRGRRAAEKRDELAAPHSITSSARCWKNKGTSRPSAFAVLRLITSSNFVGCSMGKSFGCIPCKTLRTNLAPCRTAAGLSAPYDIKPPISANARVVEAAGKWCSSARSAIRLVDKLP